MHEGVHAARGRKVGRKPRPREGFPLPRDLWGIRTNIISTFNSYFEKIRCRTQKAEMTHDSREGGTRLSAASSVSGCRKRPGLRNATRQVDSRTGCGFDTGEGSPHCMTCTQDRFSVCQVPRVAEPEM